MKYTLAFDVYGTLIDTSGVRSLLEKFTGTKAPEFSRLWREKQLEYSFRRGLMDSYTDFATCTADALNFTCEATGQMLSDEQKSELLNLYTILPAYKGVQAGLAKIKEEGHRCFAFSNGSKNAVNQLLEHAGIMEFFEGIVSAEDVWTFKPNPLVYAHFCEVSAATKSDAVLVSGNVFDVIGAKNFGMQAIWVKRSPDMVFDSWGPQPDAVIATLGEAAQVLAGWNSTAVEKG